MRPAWSVLAADIVAVVVDRAFGSAGLEHHGVEGWARALRAEGDAVFIGEGAETSHELLTEVESDLRVALTQTNDVIETPLRGGEAEWVAI